MDFNMSFASRPDNYAGPRSRKTEAQGFPSIETEYAQQAAGITFSSTSHLTSGIDWTDTTLGFIQNDAGSFTLDEDFVMFDEQLMPSTEPGAGPSSVSTWPSFRDFS